MHRTLKRGHNKREEIVSAASIRVRPAQARDEAIPRRRTGDLIVGANNSDVAMLVECRPHYVMLLKPGGKDCTMGAMRKSP